MSESSVKRAPARLKSYQQANNQAPIKERAKKRQRREEKKTQKKVELIKEVLVLPPGVDGVIKRTSSHFVLQAC